MKKLLKSLFLILGLVFSVTAMTACSDDDEGGLSGVYGHLSTNDWGSVYHFINGNTVHFYPGASYGKQGIYYKQIGSSNWYVEYSEEPRTYTYEVEDNKVIIPMKGTIMTISGNKLTEDGGLTYTKNL